MGRLGWNGKVGMGEMRWIDRVVFHGMQTRWDAKVGVGQMG